jgi:hypothetical protein
MKKFERFNKLTEVKETYVSANGVLASISDTTIPNKVSGKPYFRFTAEIDTTKGVALVAGQLYEGLIPHLGKMPQVGDKLDFNASLEDLQEGYNTRWGIGGSTVDDVASIMDDIANL